jgi:malonyl-CoA/methylmalonyl-CoA synthetase
MQTMRLSNTPIHPVTLLAAMAARAIAVPMSPAFPDPELRYILNQSEAALLVSSPRFATKAKQVLAVDLASPPAHLELPKHQCGRDAAADQISWSEQGPGNAGMMLYTSGTTNRPVWTRPLLITLCP